MSSKQIDRDYLIESGTYGFYSQVAKLYRVERTSDTRGTTSEYYDKNMFITRITIFFTDNQERNYAEELYSNIEKRTSFAKRNGIPVLFIFIHDSHWSSRCYIVLIGYIFTCEKRYTQFWLNGSLFFKCENIAYTFLHTGFMRWDSRNTCNTVCYLMPECTSVRSGKQLGSVYKYNRTFSVTNMLGERIVTKCTVFITVPLRTIFWGKIHQTRRTVSRTRRKLNDTVSNLQQPVFS
jgi:hypothetical protein